MEYSTAAVRNPKTGETMIRPYVTNRKTMNMRSLVAYAKKAGYVRGQQKDLEGLGGGLLEAAKDRALAGYIVNFNDWFIISGQLKGSVDETRQLTDANSYHVTITATKILKGDINDYDWHCVDDSSVRVRITGLSYSGAPADGRLMKNKDIYVNGRNLFFIAGDSCTMTWTEDGEEKSATITPTESDFNHMKFAWPAALDEVPADTEVTFTFRTRGGVEEGQFQPNTRTAKVVSAS